MDAYEKKYKEALEKARQLCAYPTTKPFISDLQDLFPELKESDGEKIRKALIRYFTLSDEHAYNEACGVSYRDIVAWLEKQGEQSKKHDVCDTCDEKDSCISPCCVKLVEEQGGQKPVGFNIGDEITVNGQVCRVVAVDKPVWSEEDEKMLVGCVQAMCTPDAYSLNDRINFEYWLKSLKERVQPQPRQEWSQNDIDMIDWLIRCCEKEHEELCNDKYGHQDIVSDLKRDCRKKWDWLESLKNRVAPQKQWKPSDGQMKALSNINVTGCISYAEQGQELVNLYNDLKKLRKK